MNGEHSITLCGYRLAHVRVEDGSLSGWNTDLRVTGPTDEKPEDSWLITLYDGERTKLAVVVDCGCIDEPDLEVAYICEATHKRLQQEIKSNQGGIGSLDRNHRSVIESMLGINNEGYAYRNAYFSSRDNCRLIEMEAEGLVQWVDSPGMANDGHWRATDETLEMFGVSAEALR